MPFIYYRRTGAGCSSVTTPLEDGRNDLKGTVFAAVLLTALAAVILSPLLSTLGSRMLVPNFGGPSVINQARDRFHFIWNFWWLDNSLLSGHLSLGTSLIFYPQGTSLALQTVDYVDGILFLPAASLIGSVGGYNFVLFASFFLTGLSAFLFARHLTRSWTASLVAAVIFTYFPQRLAQAYFGHPNLFSVEWLPAFLLSLILAFETKKVKYALLSGIFAALLTYTELEQLVMGFMGGGIYVVYYVLAERKSIRQTAPRIILLLAAGLAVWFVLSSPYLVPALQAVASGARPPPALTQAFTGSAHPALYLVPSPENALFGAGFASYYSGLPGGASSLIIYVGYTVIALALVGAVASKDRRKYFLMAMVLVFFLFSLGPSPTPSTPSIQTPYTILYNAFSVLRYLRSPARYSIPMMLGLCALAALGFREIASRIGAPSKRTRTVILTALVVGLILFEYAPSVQTAAVSVSPVLNVIASDPGNYGVLELPTNITLTQFYLYEQTIMDKPLVNGKVSQVPQTLPPYAYAQPFLRELVNPVNSARNPRDILDQNYTDAELGPIILSEYGIKYVVLNVGDFRTTRLYEQVYQTLFTSLGPPAYSDGSAVLFELRSFITPASILQLAGSGTLTLFGQGWGPLASGTRTATAPASLLVYTAVPGLYTLTVGSSVPLCITSSNSTSARDCGATSSGETVYTLSLLAGKNVIVLAGPSTAAVSLIQFRRAP